MSEADPKIPSTKIPVNMEDGRVVEFNAKQRISKETQVNPDGSILARFDFKNGAVRTFTIDPTAALFSKFAAHGIEQKIGDAIAGEKDDDDALISVDELIARLNSGDWTIGRQAGSNAGASILLKAIIELKKAETPEEVTKVREWLAGKSQAEKLALRKNGAIAPIIARLEADKAKTSKAPTVDTDSLLSELGVDPTPASKSKKSEAPVE